ncbi:MAG: alpha/beta fold hydrolase [Steroidobacteraceae bacterium]
MKVDAIWHEGGGQGHRTILLLHGLGATSAVWAGVHQALEQRRFGRWMAPDLSGHGQSQWQPHYSVGQLAAAVADLVAGSPELFIVGHSLGAYVGLALASGWFGVRVDGVLGVGPKIVWPEADLQMTRELANRPVRFHATQDDAWTRYRRVSGLTPEIAADPVWLARGIVEANEGWRLSQDPRTFAVAGAPFSALVSSAKARIVLVRGERDPMVSTEELRAHCANVEEVEGAGHNVHVEKPDSLVALLEQLTDPCPTAISGR